MILAIFVILLSNPIFANISANIRKGHYTAHGHGYIYVEPHVDRFTDPNCNIVNELYIYVKGLIHTFVNPKYHSDGCLDFFMLQNDSNCNYANLLYPVNTTNCRLLRLRDTLILTLPHKGNNPEHYMIETPRLTSTNLDNRDIDADEVCQGLHIFNQLPDEEKTKERYPKIHHDFAHYALYAFSDLYFIAPFGCTEVFGYFFRECVRDAENITLAFFNISAPDYDDKYCLVEQALREKYKNSDRIQRSLAEAAAGLNPVTPKDLARMKAIFD